MAIAGKVDQMPPDVSGLVDVANAIGNVFKCSDLGPLDWLRRVRDQGHAA